MTKLFYYLLFPLRLWRIAQIRKECNQRLENAIRKADSMAFSKPNTVYYVCRNAYEYFIGTKSQMRSTQEAFKKHGINWTWDKHIEYKTK